MLLNIKNISECSRKLNNGLEGLRMFKKVLECSRKFQKVQKCFGMFQKFSEGFRMFKNVQKSSRMYQEALECFRRLKNVPKFQESFITVRVVCNSSQESTRVMPQTKRKKVQPFQLSTLVIFNFASKP